MMAAAREEGLDVLADTTPFREGSASSPGSCRRGWRRRARRGARAPPRPRHRARLRTECDRYWRFIHKGEWSVRLQASEQHPDWDGLTFAEIADRRGRPVGLLLRRPRRCGNAYESVLVVGRLFTDEHLAEMISHPLFSSASTPSRSPRRGRSPTSSATRSATRARVHYLTHHVREQARCASRRRSGR